MALPDVALWKYWLGQPWWIWRERTVIKEQELTDPQSCLSKARDKEMVFVLLARDRAAPIAIRAWVEARIVMGKNERTDTQIREALRIADDMEMSYTLSYGDPT